MAQGRPGGLGLHQSPEIGRIHPQVRQRPQCIIPPGCSKNSRASSSSSPMSITAWRTTAVASSTHGPESRHPITSTHTTAPCVAYAHAAPGSPTPADAVGPSSLIKWFPFRLSRCPGSKPSGPLFDDQVGTFSIDNNNPSRNSAWTAAPTPSAIGHPAPGTSRTRRRQPNNPMSCRSTLAHTRRATVTPPHNLHRPQLFDHASSDNSLPPRA